MKRSYKNIGCNYITLIRLDKDYFGCSLNIYYEENVKDRVFR